MRFSRLVSTREARKSHLRESSFSSFFEERLRFSPIVSLGEIFIWGTFHHNNYSQSNDCWSRALFNYWFWQHFWFVSSIFHCSISNRYGQLHLVATVLVNIFFFIAKQLISDIHSIWREFYQTKFMQTPVWTFHTFLTILLLLPGIYLESVEIFFLYLAWLLLKNILRSLLYLEILKRHLQATFIETSVWHFPTILVILLHLSGSYLESVERFFLYLAWLLPKNI